MRCNKLIRGGFSFCGVDIADLGLSYAPENENTYVYRPTDVDVHEETFEGHDGSYFYGVTRKPKEFILRCYFEDEAIDRGIMERIYNLFRTGKSGKLIFSRKPWCYYYATVTSLPHPELSNYLNGLITITMKASYPFARSDFLYSDDSDIQHDFVIESTGMLESVEMVPQMSFSNITSEISSSPILLHNPGTERAPLSIMIAGNAGLGFTIRNRTTNQECKIVAMDKNHTTNVQKYVYVDGMNGNTTLVGEDMASSQSAFIYHDSGFIQLEPSYPCLRDIYVESSDSSSNIVTLISTLDDDITGQYLYIDDQWCKVIEQYDEHRLKLNKSIIAAGTNKTMITHMNEIEILPVDTIELSHLSFIYKPTFA